MEDRTLRYVVTACIFNCFVSRKVNVFAFGPSSHLSTSSFDTCYNTLKYQTGMNTLFVEVQKYRKILTSSGIGDNISLNINYPPTVCPYEVEHDIFFLI